MKHRKLQICGVGQLLTALPTFILGLINLITNTTATDPQSAGLLATPVWTALLMSICGSIGTFIWKTSKRCCPVSTQIRTFALGSLITGLLTIATVTSSIISLCQLSYNEGAASVVRELNSSIAAQSNRIRSSTSTYQIEEVELQQRKACDIAILIINFIAIFLCQFAIFFSWSAVHGKSPDMNPTTDVTIATVSANNIHPNISVAEYFEDFDGSHGYVRNGCDVINHSIYDRDVIDKSVYDDFPDFDQFRDNIER